MNNPPPNNTKTDRPETGNPELNVIFDDSRWKQKLPEAENLCGRVHNAVIRFIRREESSALLGANQRPVVNLSLGNDEIVHRLNREFRGIDRPTNVLSFANIDDPDFSLSAQSESPDFLELGDIIIALETVEREAETQNIAFRDHFCHLLVHGLLHLLGYDHQEDAKAEHMENLEIRILQQLNIKNPYEE